MRPDAVGQRFIAYSIFGIVLLIIYQFVFMARTSASRDWSHLHNSHFTLPVVQRYALRQIDEGRLRPQLDAGIPKNLTRWPPMFKKSQKIKSYSYVASITSNDHGEIPLTQYASLLVYPYKTTKEQNITFRLSELHISNDFNPSLAELVVEAKKKHKQAILVQTSGEWVPNFGRSQYTLPVLILNSSIGINTVDEYSDATIALNLKTKKEAFTYEHTIDGTTDDMVVIGDSRASQQSQAIFFELARVFDLLSRSGWQPFRTVKFVSFGHHAVEMWTNQHKREIEKHAVAFVDCADALDNRPTSAMYSGSPLVHDLAQWALQELWDGGVLAEPASLNDTNAYSIPSLRLGANIFMLNHGVPVLAPRLPNPHSTAQFLSLIVSTLAQAPILPWGVRHYDHYMTMGCKSLADEYGQVSASFDSNVAKLHQLFTEEFPWYQFRAKFDALRLRKVANLKMHYFEQKLVEHNQHLIFESNSACDGSQLRYLDTCKAIKHLLPKLTFPHIS